MDQTATCPVGTQELPVWTWAIGSTVSTSDTVGVVFSYVTPSSSETTVGDPPEKKPLSEKFGLRSFVKKELDTEGKLNGALGIDMYHFGARMYDPEIGVFLCTDPAGQYSNAYSYVGGNPIVLVDPDGEYAWLVQGLIGAGLGAIQGGIANGGEGAAWGALGGFVGGAISGSGLPIMPNTIGTMVGSTIASIGSGNGITTSFGIGSYNWSKGKGSLLSSRAEWIGLMNLAGDMAITGQNIHIMKQKRLLGPMYEAILTFDAAVAYSKNQYAYAAEHGMQSWQVGGNAVLGKPTGQVYPGTTNPPGEADPLFAKTLYDRLCIPHDIHNDKLLGLAHNRTLHSIFDNRTMSGDMSLVARLLGNKRALAAEGTWGGRFGMARNAAWSFTAMNAAKLGRTWAAYSVIYQ